MKSTEAAYVAGLLDGEGCFRIDRFRTARSPIGFQYRPVIEISMCDKGPMEFIAVACERNIQTRKTRTKGNRIVYSIAWRNTAAANLIRSILPYLRGKREQAEVLLHFNDHIAPGRGKTYRPEDFAICEAAHAKAKHLKTMYY